MLNVRFWVEGAVLEYELRCIAKTLGKFLALCWKQYEGDMRGGGMQRKVLMC